MQITYIECNGTEYVVDVESGQTLMEGAVWNHVPGILASCAGDGGCATCHVYVDEAWIGVTGTPAPAEKRTLRFAVDIAANSRLACQIPVSEALDGLVVRLPKRQY